MTTTSDSTSPYDLMEMYSARLSLIELSFGLVRGLDQGKGTVGDKEGLVVHIQ